MKSIASIFKILKSRNIKLSLSGEDKLKIESRKGALTDDVLTLIKGNKEHLVLFMKKHLQSFSSIPEIPKSNSYPLSSAQWRMWLASLLDEKTNANVISRAIVIKGNLNVVALNHSLTEVIERHEILRTVFKENSAGEVLQYPLNIKELDFTIDFCDRSSEPEGSEQWRFELNQSLKQSFDLRTGPLLRATLIKTNPEEHIFLVSMHHIISDGWSVEVLIGELLKNYNSHLTGEENDLRPLKIQYKDYAAWQQKEQKTETMKSHQEYWLGQFEGEIPVLDLPADFSRPLQQTYEGGQVHGLIEASKVRALKQLCKEKGATLFMGLLALTNALFYRYTNQKDIVIGTPVAGREHPDLENQIGFYINTLALRNKLEEDYSFGRLLNKVKDNTLRSFEHQSFPFDRLVEDLNPKRDNSHHPLFDVMLILQSQSALHSLNMTNATIDDFRLDKKSAQFDLTLEFREEGGHLEVVADYNTAIYEAWRIERMLEHFHVLLSAVTEQPQETIGQLPMLTGAEENQLLEGFNSTPVDFPKEKTVVALFEDQVAQWPEKSALVFQEKSLTYRELDELSNRFAHCLQEVYAIGNNDLVGLNLEKNEWMLVALLGVLKTGAAYVPIAINNPESRVNYIVENSTCKVLFDTEKMQTFCENIADYSSEKINLRQEANSLVAVIYTSGSTNNPKGVSIYTNNLLNRLYWMWEQYPFVEGEVGSMKTSIGFVDHLWELFGPLLQGIQLVVFDKSTLLETSAFIDQLAQHKVSRIVLVPTLLKEILAHKEDCRNKLQHLKYWTCSGEVLSADLVEEFYNTFDDHKLFNIYGSTEVTADATLYDFSEGRTKKKEAKFEPELFASKEEEEALYKTLDHHSENTTFPGREENQPVDLAIFNDVSLNKQKSFAEYRDFLQSDLSPNVINVSSASFIGHMTGPVPPIVTDLHNCVNLLNQNLVKYETSGVGTHIERQVLGCFHKLVYNERDEFYEEYVQNSNFSFGNITSGGTISNITALSYALSKKLGDVDVNQGINRRGLVHSLNQKGYKGVVVIGSTFCHYSMNKAMKIMGLGTNSFMVYDLNTDDLKNSKADLSLKIRKLQEQKKLVLAIVGVAGTTEAGMVDPLEALGEVALDNDVHYHVDGAFGGAYLFSDRIAKKLKGIEQADTVTLCGHKQLYLPVGISLCIFRDPDFVKYSEINTRYQARKGSIDLGKYTIEGSRPFSALILHGAIQMVGKEGYAEVLENNYDLAQTFAELIEERATFDLYKIPDLNILLYRYVPQKFRDKVKAGKLSEKEQLELNDLNRRIQKEQFERGKSFVSYTELLENKGDDHGVVWFRTVLMNPYTTKLHLEKILDEQELIAHEIDGLPPGPPNAVVAKKKIPIGKPINNVQIYILDSNLNLLPIGVAGEICVGGEGVVKGYLNNEELTEQKFIPNPFRVGERMYRTGDIGRWLPDGNVEFVGRKDDQIKIRGNRIELGEIETVLSYEPTVSQCVVLAKADANGDKRLIAYVVPKRGESLNKKNLYTFMKSQIPDYMIPSLMMELEEMPLNSSGKIDKKSLPDPNASAIITNEYVAPRNEKEVHLAEIWQELLNLEKVGINDNFFELGGHSLTVTRLVNKVRKELHLDIKVADIFAAPTIGEISAWDKKLDFIPILPAPKAENYPLSPAQRGLWVLSHFQGGNRAYNIPSIFHLEGELNTAAFEKAFQSLLGKHESLRTVFREDEAMDDDIRQYILPLEEVDFKVTFTEVSQSETPLKEIVLRDLDHTFDLEDGPLLKVTLFQVAPDKHLLVLLIHHIIGDGFSFNVLTKDILHFYNAYASGQEPNNTQLSIQYKDYTIWLEDQSKSEAAKKNKAYWQKQLTAPIPVVDLNGQERPRTKSYAGALLEKELPNELRVGMEDFARDHNGTLFMGLLTVLNTLLHRYTKQEDLLIGSPIAGRNHIDLENQIGYYVNTLVMRNKMNRSESFTELFTQVKQTVLDAFDHQDYPFDVLVDDLKLKKDSSRSALFDFMLVLQKEEQASNEKTLPSDTIQIRPYTEKYQLTSKFDMTFDFVARPDGLHLALEYNRDLYSAAFIEKLYQRFEALLTEIISQPDGRPDREYYSEESKNIQLQSI